MRDAIQSSQFIKYFATLFVVLVVALTSFVVVYQTMVVQGNIVKIVEKNEGYTTVQIEKLINEMPMKTIKDVDVKVIDSGSGVTYEIVFDISIPLPIISNFNEDIKISYQTVTQTRPIPIYQ